jgi:outer membrane protein OmpA-like peptidoglycan-associated protein
MAASSWMLGGLLVFGLCDMIALDALIAPRALGADQVAGTAMVAEATPVAPAPPPASAPVPSPAVIVAKEPAPEPEPAAAAVAVADPTPVVDPPAAPQPAVDLTPLVIHFDSDRATITPAAAQQLDQLAARLAAVSEISVVIVGHADERGSERDNDYLSARRMHRVRDYLGAKGVPPARMTGRAAGEHEPIETGTSEEALAVNRRVEIQLERSAR